MMDLSPAETAAIVVVLTLLYLTWRKIRYSLENKKPFEDIPMPPGSHFLLGHKGLFGSDFVSCHQRFCYDYANEDGMCSMWLLNYKGLTVTRWQDARAILQASVEHDSMALVQSHMTMFLGKHNVLALKDREWKYQRAAILRVFHSTATLMESRAAMVSVTETLVESLKKQPQPAKMDVDPLMKMITMDVFGQSALSYNFACCERLEPSPIARAFDFLEAELLRRLQSPLVPSNMFYCIPTEVNQRHAQERSVIRDFLTTMIAERQEKKPEDRNPDLLTSLLKAHEDMKEQAPEAMTDEKLVDILISLLFAGYDTTSILLTYALHVLATHPEVEERCLEEINRVYKEDGNLTNPDRLVYCGGVVQETLRIYPPAFVVGRKAVKTLQLSNGFIVPEDTFIMIPIYMIQHDPKHFQRPNEFHAERWVKRDGIEWIEREENDTCVESDIPVGNRNAVFAFSGGARSCAAAKFATQEATLVLASLVKELKFAVEPGYVPKPIRHGIIQSPKEGMPMFITSR